MNTAKIIHIAGGQAVELPAEFRFDGDIVSIRREGSAIILEPVKAAERMRKTWPDGFFESICIGDPQFVRPDQGPMPPAPELN